MAESRVARGSDHVRYVRGGREPWVDPSQGCALADDAGSRHRDAAVNRVAAGHAGSAHRPGCGRYGSASESCSAAAVLTCAVRVAPGVAGLDEADVDGAAADYTDHVDLGQRPR